jgi:hypothetical protein
MMKNVVVVSLLFLGGVVFAAGFCFMANDLWSLRAQRELVAFRSAAQERAIAERATTPGPSGGGRLIGPLRPPWGISPADRLQIEMFGHKLQSLAYRRDLARKFFVGGLLAAVAIASLSWLHEKFAGAAAPVHCT